MQHNNYNKKQYHNLFEEGVPVDLKISLSPKTYLQLGGTIVGSIIAGYVIVSLLKMVQK